MPGSETIVAGNPRAAFDYLLGKSFRAGMSLLGSEVRALRTGLVSLAGAYVVVQGRQVLLTGAHIGVPAQAAKSGRDHAPLRSRPLLVTTRERDELDKAIRQSGMTAVPTTLMFDASGKAKLEFSLAKGRNNADRRQAEADKSWRRERGALTGRGG